MGDRPSVVDRSRSVQQPATKGTRHELLHQRRTSQCRLTGDAPLSRCPHHLDGSAVCLASVEHCRFGPFAGVLHALALQPVGEQLAAALHLVANPLGVLERRAIELAQQCLTATARRGVGGSAMRDRESRPTYGLAERRSLPPSWWRSRSRRRSWLRSLSRRPSGRPVARSALCRVPFSASRISL